MRARAEQLIVVMAALSLVLVACGDDDGTDDAAGVTETAGEDAAGGGEAGDGDDDSGDDADGAGDGAPEAAGPGGGTATLGDETITIDQVLCYLEEQERAGLGGTFEFSIQASGTNAGGENVIVDITRVHPDPDGGITGDTESKDSVKVDIGEPASAVSYTGSGEVGTVTVDGSNVSTSSISVKQLTGTETTELSFDLACSVVQQ